jgi:hypothetical protein
MYILQRRQLVLVVQSVPALLVALVVLALPVVPVVLALVGMADLSLEVPILAILVLG